MAKPDQTLPGIPVEEPGEQPGRLLLWLSSGLALAAYALVLLAVLTPLRSPAVEGGLEAVLLVAATLATLASLCRELPVQNVLLAAFVIGLMGTSAHALGAATGMPFGPFTYTVKVGPCYRGVVAWPMPLIWITLVLNSRGVGRFIMRPWRKLRSYGFWLLGLTVALVVLFDLGLEPFAAQVRGYWIWQSTRLPFAWQGVPVTNFLGWTVVTTLILAFVTPALIKRRPPAQKAPPDFHPLVAWELGVALFAASAFAQRFWLVGASGVLTILAVLLLALKGGKDRV